MQPINQGLQGFTLIITAFYFQQISSHIIYLEYAHLGFVVYMILQTLVAFPESPRYDYSKDRFEQAKESLNRVARFNGQYSYNPDNFKFDSEQQMVLIHQENQQTEQS